MPPNRNHPLFNRASIQKSNMNVEETISTTSTTPATLASTTSIISTKKRNSIIILYIWDHDHCFDFSINWHWNYNYCHINLFITIISIIIIHLKNIHEITKTNKLSSNQNIIKINNKYIIQEIILRKFIIE